MANIYTSVDQLVGHTPLLELTKLEAELGLKARILAKVEGVNPGGSVKDRVAKGLLDDAEACGLIGPGATIIEPTSGNTGIGLTCIGAARGYRVIIVMPDTMSRERQLMMTAYGAELVLTPGAQGMAGAIARAEELVKEIPGSFLPGQFTNPACVRIHRQTTGPEIWQDSGKAVDIFVAGAGTGGTITGVGQYLKEQNPAVQIVAVEPEGSPVLSGGKAGPHGLQGIGAGFVPQIMDVSLFDRVVTVCDEDAYAMGRQLARKEGVFAGITAGAALWAAVELAKQEENAGKNIVVLFPDLGDRYLSTPLFGE